jgi:putative SOS response-associated peptidase YedK
MCGRFALTTDPRIVAARIMFGGEVQRSAPRDNIKPTERVPVIALGNDGQRKMIDMRWGLVPHWSKDATPSNALINARADGIAAKATWRPSFEAQRGRGGRCLIPWDAFYEWSGPKNSRQPNTITVRSNHVGFFAGLWAAWRQPGAEPGTPPALSCSIVTVEANGLIAAIHDRMPAILDDDAWPLWLGETASSSPELLELLPGAPFAKAT